MQVIVPIDDKPSSQFLIDALIGMKWVEGTEIILLSVPRSSEDRNAVEASLNELATELKSLLRHCQFSVIVREGDPKSEILELAEAVKAELILMGSNCKTGLDRLLLGSVSQAVLNGADCPVLITRPDYDTTRDAQNGFTDVLVAIDDSVYSEAAIQWLASFRWAPQTRFVVATVLEGVPSTLASVDRVDEFEAASILMPYKGLISAAQKILSTQSRKLSMLLRTENVSIDLGTGNPSDAVAELANLHSCDLIVMGSHGRTGLKKLILGSVSQAVSQQAPCSVAIVRGIAPRDKSWQRTGVFKKATELTPENAKPPAETPKRKRRSDNIPHVIPGGMG